MTFWWSLLRAWGFTVTVPLAATLGLVGVLLGGSSAVVPMIRLPVPAATLVPVVAVLVLSWTLHDRWTAVSATAVRSLWVVGLVRLAVTLATCAVPAVVGAATWGTAEPVAVSVVGTALTALLAPVLGGRVWGAVVVGGWGWLLYATRRPVSDALPAEVLVALASTAVAAVVTVAGGRRRARG
ncbi:MAG: hypothetical protein JWQ74_648 [Marmoricola sp.]|nr:hypothetical protein [Marmoricola sp.]